MTFLRIVIPLYLLLDHALENPRRLGFDLFAYQRMEPFAGGKINLDTEALLKQSLGRHQIQRIEPPAGHSR